MDYTQWIINQEYTNISNKIIMLKPSSTKLCFGFFLAILRLTSNHCKLFNSNNKARHLFRKNFWNE